MKPHLDYVCNSKGCRQEDGSAPVYDLPNDAKVCPYGHKAIRALFNHVNVSHGVARGVDRMVQPVADEHDRIRANARAGEARGVTDGSGMKRASFMEPIGNIEGVMKGGSRPSASMVYAADDGATMRPVMKPTTFAAIDRESRPA